MDVAVLNLPDFRKAAQKDAVDLFVLPVKFPQLFENFLKRFLVQIAIDELANILFHRRALLRDHGGAVRRISLEKKVRE